MIGQKGAHMLKERLICVKNVLYFRRQKSVEKIDHVPFATSFSLILEYKFFLISNRYLVLIPAKIKRPLSQPVYTNYYYNLGKKCHQSRLEAKLAKIEEFFQNFILQSGMAINCFIIRLLEWPRSWRFTTIF